MYVLMRFSTGDYWSMFMFEYAMKDDLCEVSFVFNFIFLAKPNS